MSHKIQITFDDQLNAFIKTRAKQSGLSVSSYTRLALFKLLSFNSDVTAANHPYLAACFLVDIFHFQQN